MIRPMLLFLIALTIAIVSTLQPAHAAINYNKPWAKVMRDANGNMVYVRDLGSKVGGRYNVGVSPAGINGYNNILQDANGVVLKRQLPLVGESGIIRGTEVGLNKAVQGSAWDSLLMSNAEAAAMGRIALKRAIPYVGIGITAWELYKAFQDDDIRYDENFNDLVTDDESQVPPQQGWRVTSFSQGGYIQATKPYVGQIAHSDAELISIAEAWLPTGTQCIDVFPSHKWGSHTLTVSGTTGVVKTLCNPSNYDTIFNLNATKTSLGCPDGYSLQGSVCVKTEVRLATDDEIDDAIENEPLGSLPNRLSDAADRGDGTLSVPADTPATFEPNQPNYSTSPTITTQTTQNADGSTTTRRDETTQVLTPSTSGDTAADQTLTVTVTNITNTYINNQLVQSTQQDQPAPPLPDEQPNNPDSPETPVEVDADPCKDGACDFTDPSMPPQPHLYDQKYPNGIVGVWQSKSPQIQATAFVQSITQMFPDLSGGGECPQWGMNFDIMPNAMYGDQSFGVACSIWQVVGLILLTTACFTAWRIIF